MRDKLYFITGNKGKFGQAAGVIPGIEQIDFDLPEIQELDSKKIIEEKLSEAAKISEGRFFCEDVSLEIKCLGGLPGPLVKWFLDALGAEGIYNLVSKFDDRSVVARTIVGYSDGDEIVFFEEDMEGEIVEPAGENGYGWDCLFKRDGYDKTLAEMSDEEKKGATMKTKVFLKLKEYIESNEKR
jgi:non-canonical purine NTP pyrophosphatase (RdgB/HAM1 family)